MQSIDWNDLANRAKNAKTGGDPVPANTYLVEVATCEAKMTSAGDKPMLKVRGKIVGGPYDGKTAWHNMTLTATNDTAVAIFLRHLDAYGLTTDWVTSLPPEQSFELIAQALLGRRANWELTLGSYQGKPKNDVKNVSAPTGAAPPAPVAATPGVPQVPAPAVAAAPVPVAPAVPVPAPAPVAVAPVPPTPPVPAPVAPVAPQPVPAPVAPPVPAPAPAAVQEAPAPPAPPEAPF